MGRACGNPRTPNEPTHHAACRHRLPTRPDRLPGAPDARHLRRPRRAGQCPPPGRDRPHDRHTRVGHRAKPRAPGRQRRRAARPAPQDAGQDALQRCPRGPGRLAATARQAPGQRSGRNPGRECAQPAQTTAKARRRSLRRARQHRHRRLRSPCVPVANRAGPDRRRLRAVGGHRRLRFAHRTQPRRRLRPPGRCRRRTGDDRDGGVRMAGQLRASGVQTGARADKVAISQSANQPSCPSIDRSINQSIIKRRLSMPRYADFYRQSIDDRDAFWSEQSRLIEWQTPPRQICDYSNPPFAQWFVGGRTNLCHNALDRHLARRARQPALVAISTETGTERSYSFAELHAEVQHMAAALRCLGVKKGDRVLIYLPMIAEAVFAMLACVRIGALHSVVFGGFASGSLAARIEDAEPVLVVSADAGSRAGKVVPYKPLLDAAIAQSKHKPAAVLMVDRGLAEMPLQPGRDHEWALLREQQLGAVVPCEWVEAPHPSYTLYASGTTGRPKGVQRDTGGYTVALAASMKHIFSVADDGAAPAGVFFTTSDIGWVVGHGYIIYGPLIAGMTTILYEGLPMRPDAGVWWSIVEKYRVTHMFSAPTALRVLKKHDPQWFGKYSVKSLKALWLAGEPLDAPTAQWISDALQVPVIDNYWQTETGWPILTLAN